MHLMNKLVPSLLVPVVLALAPLSRAAVVEVGGETSLGAWPDQTEAAVLLGDWQSASATTPLNHEETQFFGEPNAHIAFNKFGSKIKFVQYQFVSDTAIGSVSLNLDSVKWNPENAGGTNYFNVYIGDSTSNLTRVLQQALTGGSVQTFSFSDIDHSFESGVTTVIVRLERVMRWAGDNQGVVDVWEGGGASGNTTTPWTFIAVPEPASLSLLGLAAVATWRRR